MSEELLQLLAKYEDAARSLSAEEFCGYVMRDGVGRLYVAVLLRDLYGLNLAECKLLVWTIHNE